MLTDPILSKIAFYHKHHKYLDTCFSSVKNIGKIIKSNRQSNNNMRFIIRSRDKQYQILYQRLILRPIKEVFKCDFAVTYLISIVNDNHMS